MNILKNISLACTYLADCAEGNSAIKSELQNSAVSLAVFVKDGQNIVTDKILRELEYVVHLVEMGLVDGSISDMNADIFRKGMAKAKLMLEHKHAPSFSLAHYFTFSPEIESVKTLKDTEKPTPETTPATTAENFPHSQIQIPQIKPDIFPEETEEEVTARERKQMIVVALSRQAAGLKELRDLIPNTGDKMLQRDLNDLIRDRKIVRMGEKRWAKYYVK